MIISCRGWVLAASFLVLGSKARAQDDPVVSPDVTTGGPISTSSSSSISGSTSSTTFTKPPSGSPTTTSTFQAPTLKEQPTSTTQPSREPLAAWKKPGMIIYLDTETTFEYRIDQAYAERLEVDGAKFAAVLGRTTAKGGEAINGTNSFSVVQLFPCKNQNCPQKSFDIIPAKEINEEEKWSSAAYTFEQFNKRSGSLSSDLFFTCFGARPTTGGFLCHAMSGLFALLSEDDDTPFVVQSFPSWLPNLPLSINPGPVVVTYKGIPTSAVTSFSPEVTKTSQTTITLAATPGATDSPTQVSTAVPGGGKRLSTGAIVGIAIGSLVLVSLLALLAIFFCVRRRRRAQSGSTHEQAMLTQSHPDTSSHDPLAEKDTTVRTLIHPNSNDSSFLYPDQSDTAARQTLIPIGTAYGGSEDQTNNNFHNTSAPRGIATIQYETPSTISTAAPVFVASSSPPRRKPTNASTASAGAVSALSRNLSSSTTASTNSYGEYPVHSQLQGIGEEGSSPTAAAGGAGESQARYGETPRHFPQISDRGSNPSPFLSEPGMSAEEIARLDDEERRIDAAIAAADEQRDRDRVAGSGMR